VRGTHGTRGLRPFVLSAWWCGWGRSLWTGQRCGVWCSLHAVQKGLLLHITEAEDEWFNDVVTHKVRCSLHADQKGVLHHITEAEDEWFNDVVAHKRVCSLHAVQKGVLHHITEGKQWFVRGTHGTRGLRPFVRRRPYGVAPNTPLHRGKTPLHATT